MYFNAQRVRNPGLRTTSHSRISTFPVSQNAGRVKEPSNLKQRSHLTAKLESWTLKALEDYQLYAEKGSGH